QNSVNVPSRFGFRSFLLSGLGMFPAKSRFADQPDHRQGRCSGETAKLPALVDRLNFDRIADAHPLPVVMESLAAVQADYVHIALRRPSFGYRPQRKAPAAMPASEQHVIE